MKKIIILIILLLMMSSESFGAVSDDVYVRKDVFDVHMQSINAKLDMMLEEMKAQRQDINDLKKTVSVMSERIDRNFDTLSARIDGLDKRIDGVNMSLSVSTNSLNKRMDDLQHYLYLVLVLLVIIVALPSIQKMLRWREERKEARKSSITLEDVERLIDARMAGKAQA
ncbi:MAG: hypothetical protein II869_03915 [Synergistaceae bacterium]|nr:hypothetical protein [Synergistaceae bacterium]